MSIYTSYYKNTCIYMTDKIELKGYWWLPNKKVSHIAGTLTYIPNESITLEIIGAFESDESVIDTISLNKHEDIIWGITSDAKKVTLLNCSAYGKFNFSCTFPIMKYSCQYVIIGDHIDNINQKNFFKSQVKFPILSQWCSPCVLSTSIKYNDKKKIETTTISFNAGRSPLNSTIINDNTTLCIKGGIDYCGDYYSPKLEQYTYLEINKENDTSIIEFMYDIYMFEQFLSFAALQDVKCEKIYLYSKNEYQELSSGEKIYDTIQLIYIQREYKTPNIKFSDDFLFNYDTIKDRYKDIIIKWYNETNDIEPIRKHLIDSVKNKSVFSSIDFLIVVQALDGFCSRFRKDSKLYSMIESLIAEFSTIDKLKNDKISINEVVDSRHYYSHFMDRKKKKNIVDGYELYKLTIKLRKLLVCCLLSFVGFDNDEINKVLNKCNNTILIIH